jgi:AcrR family transcriptional regulator
VTAPRSAAARAPRLAKRERTRQQLLEATMRVLARGGTDAISIQEVTAEAGLANGTFYNYFRTREELLDATVVPVIQRLLERFARVGTQIEDPLLRFVIGIRNFIAYAVADRVWATALIRLWGSNTSVPRLAGVRITTDLIAAMKKRRAVRVPEHGAALDVIQGAVIAGIRSVVEDNAGAERGVQIAELLLRAFGVPAREAEKLATVELVDLGVESPAP